MSEESFDRENYDRSEVCANCGATVHFIEGVPSVPRCYLCGDPGASKVTHTAESPERRSCGDCGAVAYGASWLSHRLDCPKFPREAKKRIEDMERNAAKARHPSKGVRIPLRTLGDRIWSDVENRWTSRGEEFGP